MGCGPRPHLLEAHQQTGIAPCPMSRLSQRHRSVGVMHAVLHNLCPHGHRQVPSTSMFTESEAHKAHVGFGSMRCGMHRAAMSSCADDKRHLAGRQGYQAVMVMAVENWTMIYLNERQDAVSASGASEAPAVSQTECADSRHLLMELSQRVFPAAYTAARCIHPLWTGNMHQPHPWSSQPCIIPPAPCSRVHLDVTPGGAFGGSIW